VKNAIASVFSSQDNVKSCRGIEYPPVKNRSRNTVMQVEEVPPGPSRGP